MSWLIFLIHVKTRRRYDEGNGHVARLLMKLALLKSGYIITIIPPTKRIEYIQALEDAHTDEAKFLQFIAEAAHQSHLEFLRLMG